MIGFAFIAVAFLLQLIVNLLPEDQGETDLRFSSDSGSFLGRDKLC
jgi:hypothetical protein